MPELPEVETIKRGLQKKIVGKKIMEFLLLSPKTLKETKLDDFKKLVIGKRIRNVNRRAKVISIEFEGGYSLVLHMKMTGHLLVESSENSINKEGQWVKKEKHLMDPFNQYIRAVFFLEKDMLLAFSDLRKFGYIKLLRNEEREKLFTGYGPEPFSKDFNKRHLESIFSKKKGAIKKTLMDQSVIAGIGNIYADEILFASKIHPQRPSNSLQEKEIGLIEKNTKIILKKATLLGGTSSSDFRNTSGEKGSYETKLMVYRRMGLPCKKCGAKIERIVIGGRGTHFCPRCQEAK